MLQYKYTSFFSIIKSPCCHHDIYSTWLNLVHEDDTWYFYYEKRTLWRNYKIFKRHVSFPHKSLNRNILFNLKSCLQDHLSLIKKWRQKSKQFWTSTQGSDFCSHSSWLGEMFFCRSSSLGENRANIIRLLKSWTETCFDAVSRKSRQASQIYI